MSLKSSAYYSEIFGSEITMHPNPFDPNASKRQWEKRMSTWRRTIVQLSWVYTLVHEPDPETENPFICEGRTARVDWLVATLVGASTQDLKKEIIHNQGLNEASRRA